MMYEKCRNVRNDPRYANVEIWEETLVGCLENPAVGNPTEREDMAAYLHSHGLEARRRTIARSKEVHRDRMLTWDNIPENFAYLSDGTPFLQENTSTLQIYYSVDTIRRACEKGLRALVADGVHKILPAQLGDQAQLYTIHGACESGHEVPLVHALTKNKTQATYEKIFGRLQQELQIAPNLSPLRIILDFEVAAINAAGNVFRKASIEGCIFHLSQSWNRRRNALGIRKYLKGESRCRMVSKWWRTLKGIPFLPTNLLRRLPGLVRPSFPRSHVAYQKCQEFLDYLHDTWICGPFRNLWCKWGLTELRTTNLAEAYYSKLRRIIRKKNVNLQLILERIRRENTIAVAKLISLDRFPNEQRRLRRRDRLMREKFAAKMAEFERELSRGGIVTTVAIIRYCRHMARFITEKAI